MLLSTGVRSAPLKHASAYARLIKIRLGLAQSGQMRLPHITL